MFIPILDFDDLEEEQPIHCKKTDCGCSRSDPSLGLLLCSDPSLGYGKKNGACICIDCQCHLRKRPSVFMDPMVLYGVISLSMIAILYLVQK
jgi:hypothetical protein